MLSHSRRPRRFFQPYPDQVKKREKTDDEQAYTVRLQATESDVERLPQPEGDCLHPTYDHAPRQCLFDVPTRVKQ